MKKKGKGIAAAFYPSGMAGGGDFSQAVVKMKPDGTADLLIGTSDLGQGSLTIMAQLTSEVLCIPYEHVKVTNDNTDGCPVCFGSFASRVTYNTGNAVIRAAQAAKEILVKEASEMFDCKPEEVIVTEGKYSYGDKSATVGDVVFSAMYGKMKFVVGTASFGRTKSLPDPETGAADPAATMAWAATQVEVEVDTDTGDISILDCKSVYDVGKALNPSMVEGQILGGVYMGASWALKEALVPYYPDVKHAPRSFDEYIMLTTMDAPFVESRVVECASEGGPFGAKGIGEMTGNPSAPAIVNAVHDALGIWITKLPLTPSHVLEAIEEHREKGGLPFERKRGES